MGWTVKSEKFWKDDEHNHYVKSTLSNLTSALTNLGEAVWIKYDDDTRLELAQIDVIVNDLVIRMQDVLNKLEPPK